MNIRQDKKNKQVFDDDPHFGPTGKWATSVMEILHACENEASEWRSARVGKGKPIVFGIFEDPTDGKNYVYVRNPGHESQLRTLKPEDKVERGLVRLCEIPVNKMNPNHFKKIILPRINALRGPNPPMIVVNRKEIAETSGKMWGKLKETFFQTAVTVGTFLVATSASYLIGGTLPKAIETGSLFIDHSASLTLIPALMSAKAFADLYTIKKTSPHNVQVNPGERLQGVFSVQGTAVKCLRGNEALPVRRESNIDSLVSKAPHTAKIARSGLRHNRPS